MYKSNQFVQKGDKLDYKAVTPVGYHEIIVAGTIVGVTTRATVEPNEIVACDVVGVHALAKTEGEAIAQGEVVYVKDGKVTKTSGSGAVRAGVCWETCVADDATCAVKLNA